jgi:hypothetical protein
MAKWQDIESLYIPGAEQVSDSMWMINLDGCVEGRRQKVFLSRDVIKPDLAIIRISSAFGLVSELNIEAVLRGTGDMLIGGLTHSPYGDDDGIVSLGTSLPLMFLDLTEAAFFYVYLGILARAADRLEMQIFGDEQDRF